jgi:hypothetical protein
MPQTVAAPAGALSVEPAGSDRDRAPLRRSPELLGAGAALVLALLAVWHLATSARSWLLFYDADSVLPALIHNSLAVGQPPQWSMSAVLFLPETALYLVISVVVPSTKAALAVNALVNFLLLYGSLRLAGRLALRGTNRGRQVSGAVAAFAVLVGLSVLDTSSAWDAAELPSLLGTTTYYSATVFALVLAPALAVVVTRSRSRAGRRSTLGLAALSAASTLNNPLYIGWVTVPLVVALLVVAGRELVSWRAWARVVIAAGAGSVLGLVLRIPFAPSVARDTGGYADPGQSLHVLFGYYLRLTIERASSPVGLLAVAGTLAMIVVAARTAVRAVRRGEAAAAILAIYGSLAPFVVLIGAVALGTNAYRYLQPFVYAPLLALVALPGLLDERFRPAPRRLRKRRLLSAVAMATVVVSVGTSSGIAGAVAQQDSSVDCLTTWITASHRIGAGRFFTIRGPKAYLADPRQLVQVNRSFDGYLWLVNRDDYRVRAVSFVVSDSTTTAPTAHPLSGASAPTIVRCGRYTVTDYHEAMLPIGPLTSAYDP